VKESIFFVSAKAKVAEFLVNEFEGFPVKLQNRFMNFFPLISNYQEEGIRYHPRMILTDGVDTLAKNLPTSRKIQMFCDPDEHMFDSRIRALVPFCKSDWYIYIDSQNGKVVYGLLANIGSIKDKSLEDLLFGSTELSSKIANKVSAILCYANTRWTVTLKSLNGNALHTNFALDIMGHNDMDNEVASLVNASFAHLKTTSKKLGELKTMLNNMFKNVLNDIGGTLCVVVEQGYQRDEFFGDGVWLENPISLSKLFLQTSNFHEQTLNAITNLFMAMLNKDGITIVDNTGNILAFNVFVPIKTKEVGNIIGGARKRAAYTVINSRRRDIIGVYFQSYDGEIFFANVKR
jgi:hypothetical protein